MEEKENHITRAVGRQFEFNVFVSFPISVKTS